jgi:hypothetical protein
VKGLFIILSICIISGCSQPVGSTSSSGKGSNFNWLDVSPRRVLYEVTDSFNRDEDLVIKLVENGEMKKIPADDPNIKIELIPDGLGISKEVAVQSTPFVETGRHKVIVTYKSVKNVYTDEYSITVQGFYAEVGDGSDFLGIYWPY